MANDRGGVMCAPPREQEARTISPDRVSLPPRQLAIGDLRPARPSEAVQHQHGKLIGAKRLPGRC